MFFLKKSTLCHFLSNPFNLVNVDFILLIRSVLNIALCFFCTISYAVDDHQYKSSWIATKGGSEVLFLGVTHTGFSAQYPLPDTVKEFFETSDTYFSESGFSYLSESERNLRFAELFQTPDGMTYNLLMSNEEEDDGSKCINRVIDKKFGGDRYFFRNKSPIWLFELLELNASDGITDAQDDQAISLEDKFFRVAKALQKKVIFFDPEYFDSFNELPRVGQVSLLKDTCLRSESAENKEFNKTWPAMIREMWAKGDDNQSYADMLNIPLNNKRHREYLGMWFSIRNKKMLSIILDQWSDKQRVFITVGLGHLVGKDGLLQLMKNNGFLVTKF